MPLDYLDFDLSITTLDLEQNLYRARVLNAPVGEAKSEFVLPFSAVELENYILKMRRPRRGVRSFNSPEGQAALNLGRILYNTVFSGPIQAALLRSLDDADDAGRGLRICLRLSDALGLSDVPWEFLYETSLNRFLAQSVNTPIVRYLELPQRRRPLTVQQPPLRILVIIASPDGWEPLDGAGEWAKVQAATADLAQRGLVQIERLPMATLSALQRQLRRSEYHIIHYIGHGGFDAQSQQSVLLLESEKQPGRARFVSGRQLGVLLHDHRSLRLCLLNACEGARTSLQDPFSGVAQHLMQQGIPAVIAMQIEITDEAAKTLAHEFYGALADGFPVDGALGEARKAIYVGGNDVEWGTPVLYMRVSNGQLFDTGVSRPVFGNQSLGASVSDSAVKLREVNDKDESSAVKSCMQKPVIDEVDSAMKLMNDQADVELGSTPLSIRPAWVALAKPKPEAPSTSIGFDWVKVSAGKFWMGSQKPVGMFTRILSKGIQTQIVDRDAFPDEQPQRQIYVPEFWIMRVPLSNAQYKEFVNATDYPTPAHWKDGQFPIGKQDHPVVNISWYDAKVFCQWAGGRLPTEAEWEKAARGTDARIYPWGDEPPKNTLCNFDRNVGDTTSVREYLSGASPYGVLGMMGNVWEWVEDWYDEEHYMNVLTDKPISPKNGECRVLRGGSWLSIPLYIRAAFRNKHYPEARGNDAGVRFVSTNF